MAYGLQCWDESGNLILDASKRYTRLVYSNVASSGGSVDLPEIDGHETVQFGMTYGSYKDSNVKVTRSGTTVSWSLPYSRDTLILVFMYT